MEISPIDATIAAARALGNPARLRIAAMLRSGELCLCQITEVLGLAPSTVSLHIRELKRAGLVGERKDGRWVHFSLNRDQHARLWLETAFDAVAGDPQLDRDAHTVAEIRQLPVAELCSLGFEAAKVRRSRRGGVETG